MAGQNTGALATIREVTDGILFKAGIPEGRAVQIKQFVIDGYKELNLVVLADGRVQELFTMDENLIVLLPDDFIKLNDVFVPKDNAIWSLTRRKEIPMLTETYLGAEIVPDDWGGGRDISHGEGIYYQTTGGRNTEGYYTIDETKRRILFRNVSRSEVMLDYCTSGISRSDVTYIPMIAKSALEAYVMMELAAYQIIPIQTYELHKRRYEEQKSILRMVDFNFTAFTDAVYATFNGSYRR